MIKIKSQDAVHQYDSEGNAITTWDAKKCNWIVNTQYENEDIDWYGEDSDFAAGTTLKSFIESNPNWDKNPDITVTWIWDTKEIYEKAFGHPSSFGGAYNYYDTLSYPQSCVRSWGYLDYNEKEAIEQLGKYCGFHLKASKTIVRYNNKIIFEGKL